MVDTGTMPKLQGELHVWLGWLRCAAAFLVACNRQCPPLSIQEGEYCRWTHEAGAGGSAGRAGAGGSASAMPWKCGQAADACECRASDDGTGYDGCIMPKPTCCYVYPEQEAKRCACVPGPSEDCEALKMKAEATRAASCPP